MRISIAVCVVIVQCCIVAIQATTKSAMRYNKVGQLVTSDTLVWQSFTGDTKQLEFAVEAAKYHSEQEKYPIYVCRAAIEGVVVTGHTIKRDPRIVCIVSMHTIVHTHHAFEVLLNKGDAAKLTWTPWSKFSAVIPVGAISAASDGHVSTFCYVFVNFFMIDFDFDDWNFETSCFCDFDRPKIIMWHGVRLIMKVDTNSTIIIIMVASITMLDDMRRRRISEKSLSVLPTTKRYVVHQLE